MVQTPRWKPPATTKAQVCTPSSSEALASPYCPVGHLRGINAGVRRTTHGRLEARLQAYQRRFPTSYGGIPDPAPYWALSIRRRSWRGRRGGTVGRPADGLRRTGPGLEAVRGLIVPSGGANRVASSVAGRRRPRWGPMFEGEGARRGWRAGGHGPHLERSNRAGGCLPRAFCLRAFRLPRRSRPSRPPGRWLPAGPRCRHRAWGRCSGSSATPR